MIEFIIKNQNPKDYFSILKTLLYPILQYDSDWHFFNESEQGLIVRCSEKGQNIIRKILDENDIEFSWSTWEKDQDIVMGNIEYMKKIFHMNSEFAMEHTLNEQDFWLFEDRMIHSLYNNLGLTAQGWDMEYESHLVSAILIGRATYTGIRLRYLEERKQSGQPT